MLNLISQKRFQLIIIVLLTTLAYVNIFRNEFVIDDKSFILNWQTKDSLANLSALFLGDVPPGHEGVYRPVRSILYALDWKLFGANPFGYHLQSLLIHLGATVLVFLITEKLVHGSRFTVDSKSKKSVNSELSAKRTVNYLPFVTALLFGLHPIHTETITYIASSVETVGIVFYLASFYLYLRRQIVTSVVLAGLAFFSTEVTLTLPLVILLWEFCFGWGLPRRPSKNSGLLAMTWSVVPYFTLALFYVVLRFFVLHITSRGPYLADSVYLTFLTMTKVFVNYLSLLVLPINLLNNHIISPGIEAFVYRDYRTGAIFAQSILDPGILGNLLVLGLLFTTGVYFWRRVPILSFGIFWFFITLLPVSEIVPQGSILNEKFLYLPSFGYALICADLLLISADWIGKQTRLDSRRLLLGLVSIVAVIYSVLTYVRNAEWHDSIALWSKDVEREPIDNAYGYFQLGNAYAELGAVDLAVGNYQKSFEINPRFVVAVGSIAKTYNNAGKIDLAIGYYQQALSVNPYFWEAHRDLANIYFKQADFPKAKREYEEILRLLPDSPQIKQTQEALPDLKEATQSSAVDETLWLAYHNVLGLSFNMPSTWSLEHKGKVEVIRDDLEKFEAEISVDAKKSDETFEQYLVAQKQTYTTLVNEGKAFIPGFDEAHVRVWDDSQSQSGKSKLEFFLLKGGKVVHVLVGPADSVQMQNFDLVLGSLKLE